MEISSQVREPCIGQSYSQNYLTASLIAEAESSLQEEAWIYSADAQIYLTDIAWNDAKAVIGWCHTNTKFQSPLAHSRTRAGLRTYRHQHDSSKHFEPRSSEMPELRTPFIFTDSKESITELTDLHTQSPTVTGIILACKELLKLQHEILVSENPWSLRGEEKRDG